MQKLRAALGETRYRIALLAFGRSLTQVEIGRRMRMSQPAVSRHLRIIGREFRPASPRGRRRTRTFNLEGAAFRLV